MYAKVDVDAVVIRHVRPFGLMDGCYLVKWRTGRKRRTCLALVDGDDSSAAELAITEAVRSCYPGGQHLEIRLPSGAWRR